MKRTLTKAPITPKDVNLRYSKGRVLEVVLRNGYKNKGICAKTRSTYDHPSEVYITHLSGIIDGCLGVKLHTEGVQEHCRPCLMLGQSNPEDRAEDIQPRSPVTKPP